MLTRRHFRLHWRNGKTRDVWSETISEILFALLAVGELAGLERFEELEAK